MKQICLSLCEYVPEFNMLRIPSKFFGKPPEFFVTSHHTGRVIRFVTIDEIHPLFDQDQWDGEQMVYEPAPGEEKCKVSIAVIYNQ